MVRLSGFEWLALAAALLLCPGGSPAGAEPNAASGASAPARSLFDRLDRNRDGYLSSAELASDEARQTNWIAVDRNRDGRIGRGEFGLVGTAKAPPSAAAGGTRAPKKSE
jgi:EF hand